MKKLFVIVLKKTCLSLFRKEKNCFVKKNILFKEVMNHASKCVIVPRLSVEKCGESWIVSVWVNPFVRLLYSKHEDKCDLRGCDYSNRMRVCIAYRGVIRRVFDSRIFEEEKIFENKWQFNFHSFWKAISSTNSYQQIE